MTKRVFQGLVTFKSADQKTARVEIRYVKKHHLYNKSIHLTKTYVAHDPLCEAKIGEHVSIQECAPVSKNKRFEIISRTQNK